MSAGRSGLTGPVGVGVGEGVGLGASLTTDGVSPPPAQAPSSHPGPHRSRPPARARPPTTTDPSRDDHVRDSARRASLRARPAAPCNPCKPIPAPSVGTGTGPHRPLPPQEPNGSNHHPTTPRPRLWTTGFRRPGQHRTRRSAATAGWPPMTQATAPHPARQPQRTDEHASPAAPRTQWRVSATRSPRAPNHDDNRMLVATTATRARHRSHRSHREQRDPAPRGTGSCRPFGPAGPASPITPGEPSPQASRRTRMREHSSQRATWSGLLALMISTSDGLSSRRHPSQRRPLSSAAPSPPSCARSRS